MKKPPPEGSKFRQPFHASTEDEGKCPYCCGHWAVAIESDGRRFVFHDRPVCSHFMRLPGAMFIEVALRLRKLSMN